MKTRQGATKATEMAGEHEKGAEWVRQMQSYFEQNGRYRSNDLVRLLGEPDSHLELRASGEFSENLVHNCVASED